MTKYGSIINSRLYLSIDCFQIPENSVELILQKYDIDENMLLNQADVVPSKIFAVIREYFCYKVYLVRLISYYSFNFHFDIFYTGISEMCKIFASRALAFISRGGGEHLVSAK